MSVQSEMTALADQVRRLYGGTAKLGISAMTAALAGVISGVSSGAAVTEYIVTEDADRSLWLNEQGIKLVKGINLLVSSKMLYNANSVTCVQGAVTAILLLWDGVSTVTTVVEPTANPKSHLRGFQIPQSAYSMIGSVTQLEAGNTTQHTVAEDGLLTCATSAAGVTTGNYNNSFIEGGYTYYLMQVLSEEVC